MHSNVLIINLRLPIYIHVHVSGIKICMICLTHRTEGFIRQATWDVYSHLDWGQAGLCVAELFCNSKTDNVKEKNFK